MSPVSNKTVSKNSDEIDLGRLFGELIDHRKLLISLTSFFTLIALAYALLSTPIYQADALIQVEQKQGNALLNTLSQVLPDTQPQSAPEIALLQSRMILGKTVDDLNLQAYIEPDYIPIIGAGWARLNGEKPGSIVVSRLYMAMSSDDSKRPELTLEVKSSTNYSIFLNNGDEINGTVGKLLEGKGVSLMVSSIDAEPGQKFRISYMTRLKAISDIQDVFTVTDQGKDVGMLQLKLTGDNVEKIKDILDSISNNYLAQNIDRQAAQDAKSLEFLDRQLPAVKDELYSSEDKLNQYRQQKDSVDLSLEAKSILDQIVNVDNQLNAITFRESEISQLYTKAHPTYKALLEKRNTLQEERQRLNKKVSSMPATQQEILRLSRDVESGRAVYMQLLNRQQELNIAKSSAIGNVRIIDNAVTQPKPIKPKKVLIVLVGFVLGGIISIGVVLLRVFLRRGIESPEQIEELGFNVYASIPVSESIAKSTHGVGFMRKKVTEYESFLAIDNPADLAIEAIRGLRTSLHFAMMEAKNNILMISGASPDAGKTFVSTNLAAVISQTGKRVLYIDCDMRKSYAHKLFKTNNENGLSDLISGKVEVDKAIKKISNVDIDFISRGITPPNPAELLMHPRFKELLAWASKNYDLVIIDTPPILAVTDAAIIGSYAGTTLLVARYEQNTAKEIEVSIKRFEQSGVSVKGCILNGVIKKVSSYYGYGYSHYGYDYNDKN